MNKSNVIFSFILFSQSFLLLAQQEKKFYKGIGIEAGAGLNTTRWHYDWGAGTTDDPFSYRAFWVQPSARIFYSIPLCNFSETKKMKMPVFIGYYSFGGMGKDRSVIPVYKEISLFRSIEVGINPCIERNKIQFGLLFKGQYIFFIKERMTSYYFLPPFWEKIDISKDYKTFAMNTGIKLKYKIIKGFSISGEAWFGITNLYAHSTYGNNAKLRVTENNYRIMIGYEL